MSTQTPLEHENMAYKDQLNFVAQEGQALNRFVTMRRWGWLLSFGLAALLTSALLLWAHRERVVSIAFEYLPSNLQAKLILGQSSSSTEGLEHLDKVYLGLDGNRISSPVYNGFDSNNDPYVIRSRSGMEVKTQKGVFLLEKPEAIFKQGTAGEIYVSSNTGRYTPNQRLLLLHDNVKIKDSRGGQVLANQANVLLNNAHIHIIGKVVGNGQNYTFGGSSLDVHWEANTWTLIGPAQVSLFQNAP